MMKLPVALEKEPLVDAVFEVRLGGDPHVADILPGVLFGQITPKPTIQRLPASGIPQQLRLGNPNFMFEPVISVDYGEFTVSLGDRNIVLGCKLPYPKWPRFKSGILDIVDKVLQVGITAPVERYSLKYVNLISGDTIADQLTKINMAIRIGDVEVKDDYFSIQVQYNDGDIRHIMSVISGARGQLVTGESVFGTVLDIDSVRVVQSPDFEEFSKDLEPKLQSLRLANKIKFFSCLTESAINEMGPQYD